MRGTSREFSRLLPISQAEWLRGGLRSICGSSFRHGLSGRSKALCDGKELENEPEEKDACVNATPRAHNSNSDHDAEHDETERKAQLVLEHPHHSYDGKNGRREDRSEVPAMDQCEMLPPARYLARNVRDEKLCC